MSPQARAYALEANAHRSNKETVGILSSLLTQRTAPSRTTGCRFPTLLVHGELDPIGDIGASTPAWALREPSAEYAVIPGAGHTGNLDNPQAFTVALLAFLDRVVARSTSPAAPAHAS